jgi:hypothetical protein
MENRWAAGTIVYFLSSMFAVGPARAATPWSGILDPSRAIDWTSAGFTIPNYTTDCATQPSLVADDPTTAAANSTAIQNALASCDATHNVVNIPAGTYYVAGWTYATQGKQAVRGAGPNSTTIILTAEVGCAGMWHGVCMISGSPTYGGSDVVMPPSGSNQCSWTDGYAKGSTTITLSNCGGAPPINHTIILDQANETSDTGGIYTCDSALPGCTVENSNQNHDGRVINGVTHSQQQVSYVTGVAPLGTGSYSVTISPGVYFNNIRSSQSPGAWWSDTVQNDGLENLTLDGSYQISGNFQVPDGNLTMFDCYQCWERNVRSLKAGRSHVLMFQGAQNVVRDSYFYQAQGYASQSYAIEFEIASSALVENNIFQQVTNPLMFGQGSGDVIGCNFSIDDLYGTGTWPQASYYSHNAGNAMNLWEGNNLFGIWADDSWGSSALGTEFRNMLLGWQNGKSNATWPVVDRTQDRAFNIVGNVLGQPGYHTAYQTYATSTSGGVGETSDDSTSIYEIGWGDNGGFPTCSPAPACDPLVFSTLMRWGNYDVVTNGVKWDPTEASPAAVPYVNANFTPLYFSSLAQTLPPSLYYSSKPSWWPAAKAWPPIGPDVSAGNLGICSGTYAGAQATAGGQCAGGSLSSAWAAHANSIPAQDCYLNVMGGPPDGTGNVLPFDADTCYGGSSAQPPPPPPSTNASAFSPQVYPNPWRADKHSGQPVTFANLPSGSTVKIFTVSGHLARDLGTVNGSVAWDLTNDSGDKVASGIYLYLITDSQGDKVKGKVAVIK